MNNKNRDRLRRAIFIIAGLVFIISVGLLIRTFYEYRAGNKEYEELRSIINEDFSVNREVNNTPEGADNENTDITISKKEDQVERISRESFEKLSAINPDIVGWIQFDHIDISYPIVKAENNDYYLKHTFRKEVNKVGSIFMDYTNNEDFTDPNTFIYGHNMKDGSMFAFLNRYKEESFYKENPVFVISTPEGEFTYEIFSCYVVSETGDSYVRYGGHSDDYGEYLSMVKSMSLYDTGVEVDKEDKVAVLSTCTRAGEEYRFVVVGKR